MNLEYRNKKRKVTDLVRKGMFSLRSRGFIPTARKVFKTLFFARHFDGTMTYREWTKIPLYTKKQLEEQRRHTFRKTVKLSVITSLSGSSEIALRDMIESLTTQTYGDWELCMAGCKNSGDESIEQVCLKYAKKDDRIRCLMLEKDPGMVCDLNACIEMSTGDYICRLDQGDVLHPAALHDIVQVINEKNADLIYTDEAMFISPDMRDIQSIHFKPDYAPDNLRANNYMRHFMAFKRSLLERTGAFRREYEGSQDHDLTLRLAAVAEEIIHLPKVLYYCRVQSDRVVGMVEADLNSAKAGRKAVQDSLLQMGIEAEVESVRKGLAVYRVSYPLPATPPKVSIIIPNCDHVEDLKNCLSSIDEKSTYRNYEVIVVENNSTDPAVFLYYEELESAGVDKGIKVIRWPGKGFNWSAINNYAVCEAASGDYLLFLNNDTEVISPGWIEEMLMHAVRHEVGAVGAMLYYPDDTIQHAGIIIGFGGTARETFKHTRRGDDGYMGRLLYAQDVSAVTGACLMMRRSVFDKVGGIDEDFAVGLNDVDLCMRIRKEGYLIVWTPYAELYHYESKSRRELDRSVEGMARCQREGDLFRMRWSDVIAAGDPYYNPNLSLKRDGFVLDRAKTE